MDDADYERASQHKWYFDTSNGYARTNIRDAHRKRSTVLLHRFLVEAPADLQVDHRDGDRLNCIRANLRQCPQKGNCANKGKSAGKSSSFKGVSYRKSSGTWKAYGWRAGRFVNLGSYQDEGAAALAYDAWAKTEYGEFARLNNPKEARDDMTST